MTSCQIGGQSHHGRYEEPEEVELAAVRHQQGPGVSVQDQVQQPQGAHGHTEGGQSDHTKSRASESWKE